MSPELVFEIQHAKTAEELDFLINTLEEEVDDINRTLNNLYIRRDAVES